MGHLLIYEMMHSWNGSTLSWPPTSHTVKQMFLYSTVSTLKPIVGIVVTISPSFSLYRMVVFPAASSPTMRILICFLPKSRENTLDIVRPMATSRERRKEGPC